MIVCSKGRVGQQDIGQQEVGADDLVLTDAASETSPSPAQPLHELQHMHQNRNLSQSTVPENPGTADGTSWRCLSYSEVHFVAVVVLQISAESATT